MDFGEEGMLALLAGALIAVLSIRVLLPLSPALGLLDKPGGHKQHGVLTPTIGGLGIFLGFMLTLSLYWNEASQSISLSVLLVCACLVLVTGLLDDLKQMRVRIRLLVHAGAAFLMALYGDVYLKDLGQLVPGGVFALGAWAIPFTLIASVGSINALNMVDGMDGLAGVLSFLVTGFVAMVAFLGGQWGYFLLASGLLGGLLGFLVFNLRYGSQTQARVYMGDAGSNLLGFVFVWFFIALSQGESRAMTPVTALWLFAVPLMDTVTVALRRIWLKKSPIRPDRSHLHHLFMDAGFRVSHTLLIIGGMQLLLGLMGMAGLWLKVPEMLMLGGFLILFSLYFFVVSRPWRMVPVLRRLHHHSGLAVAGVREVFVGGLDAENALSDLAALLEGFQHPFSYRVFSYPSQQPLVYATVCVESTNTVPALLRHIQRRLPNGALARQYIPRSEKNDPRRRDWGHATQRRQSERRQSDGVLLISSGVLGNTIHTERAAPQRNLQGS